MTLQEDINKLVSDTRKSPNYKAEVARLDELIAIRELLGDIRQIAEQLLVQDDGCVKDLLKSKARKLGELVDRI